MIPEINGSYEKHGIKSEIRTIHAKLTNDEAFVEGQYRITLSDGEALIEATGDKGIAFGKTALNQLLAENGGVLEDGVISDRPAFLYRGFLIDSVRHFFPPEEVKTIIDEASRVRMSHMHWHLSDDQGYRMESSVHPEVTSKEHYTLAEIKDIIDYAAVRGIDIVPELDMPGHVTAILRAHPEFSCKGALDENRLGFGVFRQILCAGNDAAVSFMKDLLLEICSVFPYEKVHIGGDEAPKAEWCGCPKCQAKIRKLGLKDEESLQAYFTNEMADFLLAHGKRPVCWNEALRSDGLSTDVTIQYWDEENKGQENAFYCRERLSRGYQWIYSFSRDFYFDYSPALCPIRNLFHVDNRLRSGDEIPAENILGYECAFWAEKITGCDRLQALAFPRMYAVAELGWSGKVEPADFEIRCRSQIHSARERGINALSYEEANPAGQDQIDRILSEWKPSIEMARQRGMAQYIPVIQRIIRGKVEHCMTPDEIDRLFEML